MAYRISIEEAKKRGLISPQEAQDMKQAEKKSKNIVSRSKKNRYEIDPQMLLWLEMKKEWHDRISWEFKNAVPGRKFKLDIAFEDIKLAIEFDGWQYHGKFKSGFQKDREKQNLLSQNGWRILRFYYSEVRNEMPRVINDIKKMVNLLDLENTGHKKNIT